MQSNMNYMIESPRYPKCYTFCRKKKYTMHHTEAFCVGFFHIVFFKEMNTKCEQFDIKDKIKNQIEKILLITRANSNKCHRRDIIMEILFMRQILRL